MGETLRRGLAHEHVTEVRGQGLFIGLSLSEPRAAAVARAALAAGFIVNDCAPDRIRLAPPLVLSEEQVAEVVAAWPGILAAAWAPTGEGPSA